MELAAVNLIRAKLSSHSMAAILANAQQRMHKFVPDMRTWLMSLALALLLFMSAEWIYERLPARYPLWVEPDTLKTSITEDGLWQVERKLTTIRYCNSITVARSFRGTIRGKPVADFKLQAARSSLPGTNEPLLTGPGRPPGTSRDWWAYRPVPGFKGSYIVSAALSECDGGFNGVMTMYVLPVDWTFLDRDSDASERLDQQMPPL